VTTILTKNTRTSVVAWQFSTGAGFSGHRVLDGWLSVLCSKQSDRSKKMKQVTGDSYKGQEKGIDNSFYFRLHNTSLSVYDMTFASLPYA
jgi:hypothetical protein